MKKFRRIALSALLTIGAFSAVTYMACNKDACANVSCGNNGSCVNGTCNCSTGYEGTNCQTLSRDKFIGTYTGTETCSTGNDNYSITLASNSNALVITLTNLYNQGFTATCNITGTNTFSFNGSQTGVTFTGNGTLNGNQLTVTYAISNGSSSNNCTYVGNK